MSPHEQATAIHLLTKARNVLRAAMMPLALGDPRRLKVTDMVIELDAFLDTDGGPSTPAMVSRRRFDTSNKFLVAKNDKGTIVMRPLAGRPLDQDDAHNLAGWLVALNPDRDRFLEVLGAIENT
jgi:hypothetical protein